MTSLVYDFRQKPDLKIDQITATHTSIKPQIGLRLTATATSAVPKKAQRNPEIRYTTGLNRVLFCHRVGRILMEWKLPPRNTSGVMISIGIRFSCSKFSAQMP